MEVFKAIKERRSIRKFKKKLVPYELLTEALDAARWAPSAGNLQPHEFIIVEDDDIKEQLAIASLKQMFIKDAPVVVVFCVDTERTSLKYGLRGKHLYSVLDGAAAIENFLIASYALGLGSCWVSAFDETAVRNILKLPTPVLPLAIVPVGFPDETPSPPPRIDMSHIIHHDQYGRIEELRGTAGYELHKIAEETVREEIAKEEQERIKKVTLGDASEKKTAKKIKKKKHPILRIFS